MARYFTGGGHLATTTAYLSGSTDFTVVLWVRPDSLTPAAKCPLLRCETSGGNYWQVEYTTGGTVQWASSGHSGTITPATNSATAAFSAIDLAHGKRVLYRYQAGSPRWAVWTGSRTGGLVKKTIAATGTLTLPTVTSLTLIGTDGVDSHEGAIAEVGIYSAALSDADCELLMRGTACDQVGGSALVAYWPLRGTQTLTEPDYVSLPALTSATEPTGLTSTEAHPPVVGLDTPRDPFAAWAAEIKHADGTVYVASTELARPVDVDVLGRAYPGRILNGDSVTVAKQINDGIVAPGTTTLVVANDVALSPAEVAAPSCWLEADQVRLDTDDTPIADGDTVLTWPDVSGRGANAANVSSGPTYDADGINGRPALLYDAVGERHRLALPQPTSTSAQPYTIVACFTRADAAASTHVLMAADVGAWQIATNAANQVQVGIGTGGTLTLGSVTAVNAPQVVSYIHSGSNAVLGRLNQGAWFSGTTSVHPGARPYIGATAAGANDLEGRVAAVLIYPRALDEYELRRVENYLASKYGCTAVPHATIGPRREWRGTEVVLRRYERTSHELVTELIGRIADVDWSRPGVAAFTLVGAAIDVLQERVPKALVNVDEHASATDLLAPVPVGFGDFWVAAPYIGKDEATSPGRFDFAVTHLYDAAGSTQNVTVDKVLFDLAPGTPGLETATSWYEPAGATPTKTASVTNKLDLPAAAERFYEVGTPVRLTISGTLYYSHVTTYTAGSPNTVTLAHSIVTANPTKVEVLAGAYLIDRSTYTSGGDPLVTVRFAGTGQGGGVVAFGRNASITNPADVIEEILTHPTWGLGQAVDAALFAVAAADFTTAGLGSACNYALGGDRQQRSARQVLGELLALRGAWLDLQPDGTWGLYVDKLPAWNQSRTFACGDKRFAQIERVQTHTRTPLAQLTRTLKLRYRKKGRSRTNEGVTSWLAPTDYEFQNNYTVNASVGADRIITNPWLDRATHAGRVVVYQGKRLAAEDESIDVRVGPQGRNVDLGEIVRLVIPHSQVDADYRVIGYTRTLGGTVLRTVGYSAGIFSYSSSEVEYDAAAGVNTSADDIARDEEQPGSAVGPNQVLDANFAMGLGNTYTPATTKADAATLPGWIISEGDGGSTAIGALSVTRSPQWMGRHYVSVQIDSVNGNPRLRTNSNLTTSATNGGLVVEPGSAYIVSAYISKSGASKASDAGGGFKFEIEYYKGDGTASTVDASDEPYIRAANVTTGPNTGTGPAMRWWGVTRAPSDAVYARLNIEFTATGTYYVGAVAFNQVNRFIYTPPPWSNTTEQSYGPLS